MTPRSPSIVLAVLLGVLAAPAPAAERSVWLDELDLGGVRQGWGSPRRNLSVQEKPLRIAGQRFERGIGTHAPGGMSVRLDGKAQRLVARVGADDEVGGGRGSIEFVVLGDGFELWRSGVMRAGDVARGVNVSLEGVRTLNLVVTDADDGESADHADWVDARISFGGKRPVAEAYTHSVVVQPAKTHQVIDNFGASDCWRIQKVGTWSDANRRRVAELLFSKTKGIGLSCWRFNIGAGTNTETISRPWRTVENFEGPKGGHDWTRQPGSRWFLRAAKESGVERFVAFACSPPGRMTRNGLTNCSPGKGSTNLAEGREADFARYLADVVEHFATDPKEAVEFDYVSPVNEPQWEWNADSGHEGNRASNPDLTRIYLALDAELRRRKLRTRVQGVESGNPAGLVGRHAEMTAKYGQPYGGYVDAFCGDERFASVLDHVITGHSYWANGYGVLVSERRRLRAALDRYPDWRYWQTEYCPLSGPRGESIWGRDLSMTLALWIARIVHYDLTIVNASAWHWWTAVSQSDAKDGLIYTDWKKPGDVESVIPSKLLWAFGNYSRFIRPGMRRVDLSGVNHGLHGLLGSGYASEDGETLVLVFVNMSASAQRISVNVAGRDKGAWIPYLTSDSEGDDLRQLRKTWLDAPYVLPPRSVVTLVSQPKVE